MSKIAQKIAITLAANNLIYIGTGTRVAQEIDRAIEGKIISKSEVDALRKDSDAFVFTGSLLHATWQGAAKNYEELEKVRRVNSDLAQVNTSLWNKNAELCGKINSLKADLQSAINLHMLEVTTPKWWLFWRKL